MFAFVPRIPHVPPRIEWKASHVPMLVVVILMAQASDYHRIIARFEREWRLLSWQGKIRATTEVTRRLIYCGWAR